jgi:cytochrome c-type biogenesis protein CcmH
MSPEDRTQMIRGMVQRLADKLAENPDDRDGWLRLGRAYQVLGETGKADDAFAKAKALAE